MIILTILLLETIRGFIRTTTVSLDEKNTMVSKAAVDFKDGTDDDAILAVGYY